ENRNSCRPAYKTEYEYKYPTTEKDIKVYPAKVRKGKSSIGLSRSEQIITDPCTQVGISEYDLLFSMHRTVIRIVIIDLDVSGILYINRIYTQQSDRYFLQIRIQCTDSPISDI